jgi:hypothetical protein
MERGRVDSGHYDYSNNSARPAQQDRRPEGSRQNSSSSLMSHGQLRPGVRYQPNHGHALEQDIRHDALRQNSISSLRSQGRQQSGGPYQPNDAHTLKQDPRHELIRQTSQHSSVSQGQHLRTGGIVPNSSGQPVYTQNIPRRLPSTARYSLSGAEQQRGLPQQRMVQSVPEGLAEGT